MLVLLGIGGAVAIGAVNGTRSPEAMVEQYVQLIADGRAGDATELVAPTDGASADLLTDDVLAAAIETIQDVEVGDARGSGDQRTVSVSYTLAGQQHTAQLLVTKRANDFLVLENWEVTTPLIGSVDVMPMMFGPGGIPASIGGVEFPVSTETSLSLYPGVYELQGPEDGFFELSAEPFTVSVDEIALPSWVQVAVEPTERLQTAVQEQADAYLDECVASTAANLECGLWAFLADGPVTWEIVEYPEVTIHGDGSAFMYQGGIVRSTYESTFLGETTTETSEDQVYLAGTIAIDGDTVTVDFGR